MRGLNQLELHANRLSGVLPSQLGALSLRACVLTAAQGSHQPTHGLRTEEGVTPDTNRFVCPLPAALPPPCVPHLRCAEGAQGAQGQGSGARHARAQRRQTQTHHGRGGRRGTRRLLRGIAVEEV